MPFLVMNIMGSETHQQKWAWGGAQKSGGAKNSSHARAVYNHGNYPVSGIHPAT